jgi:hypothetical protein
MSLAARSSSASSVFVAFPVATLAPTRNRRRGPPELTARLATFPTVRRLRFAPITTPSAGLLEPSLVPCWSEKLVLFGRAYKLLRGAEPDAAGSLRPSFNKPGAAPSKFLGVAFPSRRRRLPRLVPCGLNGSMNRLTVSAVTSSRRRKATRDDLCTRRRPLLSGRFSARPSRGTWRSRSTGLRATEGSRGSGGRRPDLRVSRSPWTSGAQRSDR